MNRYILYMGIAMLTLVSHASADKVACLNNDAKACYTYALPLITGENAKVQDTRQEGLKYMRKACVFGYDKACDLMGENYYKDKSYIAARPLLEQSCDRGVKHACEAAGTIYRDGHDVRPNDVKSREFFEKACTLKSGDACYNVAIIYRGGFGVTKSRIEEKSFYQKACNAGLEVGCDKYTELDNEDKGIKTSIIDTIKSFFTK